MFLLMTSIVAPKEHQTLLFCNSQLVISSIFRRCHAYIHVCSCKNTSIILNRHLSWVINKVPFFNSNRQTLGDMPMLQRCPWKGFLTNDVLMVNMVTHIRRGGLEKKSFNINKIRKTTFVKNIVGPFLWNLKPMFYENPIFSTYMFVRLSKQCFDVCWLKVSL